VNQSEPVSMYVQSVLDVTSFLCFSVLARVAIAANRREQASGRILSSLIWLVARTLAARSSKPAILTAAPINPRRDSGTRTTEQIFCSFLVQLLSSPNFLIPFLYTSTEFRLWNGTKKSETIIRFR
jgi:hypothetical protein